MSRPSSAPASAAQAVDPATLAREVARRRRALGWSQVEMAARAGLIDRCIGQIEAGHRSGSLTSTVYAIARTLGTRMESLLGLPALEECPPLVFRGCKLLRFALRDDPPEVRERAMRVLADLGIDPMDPGAVLDRWSEVRARLDAPEGVPAA